MGKPDTVMQSYLSDKCRFADLFNGILFQGRQVIRFQDLQEASERYSDPQGQPLNQFRDVKVLWNAGGSFRILAVENQQHTDYTMPCRCMRYDVMEYEKQLKERKSRNRSQGHLKSSAEKLCGITEKDRLIPIYTLCLYHGEEPWSGPLSLKDVMDFGTDREGICDSFAEYPFRLFCVSSAESFEMFHTELREFFGALKYRRDKAGLLRLLETNEHYAHLSAETAEALLIMLNVPQLWEKWTNTKGNNGREEEYDMCQAILELQAESRIEGKAQGIVQGTLEKTKIVIKNMLKRGFSDEDICALAECSVELIDSIR